MGQTAEDLRGQLAEQRADLGRDLDALGDRVIPSRIVQRRQQAVKQRFTDIKDRVMGVAEGSMESVHHAGDSASSALTGSASKVAHGTRSAAEGNPLAMGLVAFGAGLVAATLFPATRTEQKLGEKAQPALEKAASEAAPAAQHLAAELKPAAEDALADLKDSAKDAAASVKEEATAAAEKTKQQVAEKAKQTKSST